MHINIEVVKGDDIHKERIDIAHVFTQKLSPQFIIAAILGALSCLKRVS